MISVNASRIPVALLLGTVSHAAFAAGPLYLDVGGFVGMLGVYIAVFAVLTFVANAYEGRTRALLRSARLFFLLAPFIWLLWQGYEKEQRDRRIYETQERARRETEEGFIRFCKERGEKLPACDKHRVSNNPGN